MFAKLKASGHLGAPRCSLESGAVALLAHGAIVCAAVWAPLRPPSPVYATPRPIVVPWPDDATSHHPLPGPPETIDAPPSPPSPPVNVPSEPPIGLPPVDGDLSFDPRTWLPTVESVGAGSTRGADRSDVWSITQVDELPVLLSASPPVYPELLRRAGIAGRVVVQAVVDTLGQAEPGSLVVVESPALGFATSARDYVLRARFRPGRTHGRAVRVLVQVPLEFRLARE